MSASNISLGPSLGLLRHGPANIPTPTVSLAGVKAVDFYLECMLSGGVIPSNFASAGDKRRAKLAFELFNAFAKPEERQRLLPQAPRIEEERTPVNTEIERQQLGRVLEGLVVARLSLCYTELGLSLPRDLSKGSKLLLVGTVETRMSALKDAGVVLDIDRAKFAKFRSTIETPAPAPAFGAASGEASVRASVSPVQPHVQSPRKRKAPAE